MAAIIGGSYSRKRKSSTAGGSSLKRALSNVLAAESKAPVATVATVARMIRRTEEMKYLSETPDPVALSTAGPSLTWLNAMAVGAARYQRAGNRCLVRSIDLRIGLESAANAAAPSRIRCILFVDKQPNGVTMTPSQLFLGAGVAAPAAANLWRAPFNPAYVPSRFKVLMDKQVAVEIFGGANNFGERKAVITKRVMIPPSLQQAQWNDGVTGTIADLNKMAYYFLAVTDYSGAGGTTPSLVWSYCTNFTDA